MLEDFDKLPIFMGFYIPFCVYEKISTFIKILGDILIFMANIFLAKKHMYTFRKNILQFSKENLSF